MSGKRVAFVAILVIFLEALFLKTNFVPTEKEILLRYLAVSKWEKVTPLPSLSAEMPYPIPVAYVSLWGKQIAFSQEWFRLPNLVMVVVGLLLFYAVALRQKTAAEAAVLIAAVCPWLVFEGLFDLPSIMTLTFALGLYLIEIKMDEGTVKWISEIILIGFITMSSFAGPVFGLLFLGWKYLACKGKRKRWLLAALLLSVWVAGVIKTGWWKSQDWFWAQEDLSIKNEGELVDQRVRYEYKINGYQDIVPLPIKRIVYNKFYFIYRAVTGQIVRTADLEKWAFPGQSATTVAKSLWGSKGLPWIMFWQIILAISALNYLSREEKEAGGIFLLWAIAAMSISSWQDFLGPGIGIVVPMSIWPAAGWNRVSRKMKWLIGVILIWGVVAWIYHLGSNEVFWRDTRPLAQMKMAEMAEKFGQGKKTQVTTILGRSFLYYAYKTKLPARLLWSGISTGMIGDVAWDHFDLKNTKPKQEIYVGFPGEFVGNKQPDNSNAFNPEMLPVNMHLLESYQTHDSLSFGNGDYIWAVEVKK